MQNVTDDGVYFRGLTIFYC